MILDPFPLEQEVSMHLGTKHWTLSPRIALPQGEDAKVRVIDDYKMSGVSKSFGFSSCLELQDTDYTVDML